MNTTSAAEVHELATTEEGQAAESRKTVRATYSPEDNKLRISSAVRFTEEECARLRDAGFSWAPQQRIWVAAMWTPDRETLCLELAGEIDDEDTTMAERAEVRAERFSGYGHNRAADAQAAHRAVEQIAGAIPFGQPILVGHHSQHRAERDAQRIENAMRKAVNAFETSQYWAARAKSAVRHAQYLQAPGVRHRRIKSLEADLRKHTKEVAEAAALLKLWQSPDLSADRAKKVANYDHISASFPLSKYPRNPPASQYEGSMSLWSALSDGVINHETAARLAIAHHTRVNAWRERWINHLNNRLLYERAMLGESGGLASDRFDIQPGGRVLVGGVWVTVLRVNKSAGRINSLTTSGRGVGKVGIEEVKDYQAPTAEAAEAVAKRTTPAPLCNYDHESFIKVTKEQWEKIPNDYKGTETIGAGITKNRHGGELYRDGVNPFEAYGRHRVRLAMGVYVLQPEQINGMDETARWSQKHHYHKVYITDQKTTLPPVPDSEPLPKLPTPERVTPQPVYTPRERTVFDDLKDTLKTGVKAVSANQLFPTPPDLARHMVELAGLVDGDRVLEPSFGTMRLIDAMVATDKTLHIVGVEINADLCKAAYPMQARGCTPEHPQSLEVVGGDFLEMQSLGRFSAVVMNPPFAGGQDIKHIEHAFSMLQPGGRLVAICAHGPRQVQTLQPLAQARGGEWKALPAGTFSESGTNVSAALLVMHAPD